MSLRTNHDYPVPKQFIAGEWRSGDGGIYIQVRDPATGKILADVPRANARDLNDALEAADKAYTSWRSTSAIDRGEILRGAARLLRNRIPDIAELMTLEQGKTLAESNIEVNLTADTFDWYAAEGLRSYGRVIPSRAAGARQLVIPQPLGPIAAFTPWNFPALLPARKIAPALAAGCTLILKPSEETPASAIAIARALQDAGLPDGVLNIVLGDPSEISEHLARSGIIKKIAFTGSTPVGKVIAKLAAENVKPATLELGGHAPVLIFEDCDLDKAVATCIMGKTRNAGQVCTSPTRFYIQDGIYDEFLSRTADGLKQFKVGSGLDPVNQMGALANSRRVNAMSNLMDEAVTGGGKVLAGGKVLPGSGYFFEPTLIAGLSASTRPMTHEPFGPVMLANRFSTVEQGVSLANSLPYGLAAYLFTTSAATAMTVGESLEAGGIGINTFAISQVEAPFGGLKESGYGKVGGPEGMAAYMHSKYIHHA